MALPAALAEALSCSACSQPFCTASLPVFRLPCCHYCCSPCTKDMGQCPTCQRSVSRRELHKDEAVNRIVAAALHLQGLGGAGGELKESSAVAKRQPKAAKVGAKKRGREEGAQEDGLSKAAPETAQPETSSIVAEPETSSRTAKTRAPSKTSTPKEAAATRSSPLPRGTRQSTKGEEEGPEGPHSSAEEAASKEAASSRKEGKSKAAAQAQRVKGHKPVTARPLSKRLGRRKLGRGGLKPEGGLPDAYDFGLDSADPQGDQRLALAGKREGPALGGLKSQGEGPPISSRERRESGEKGVGAQEERAVSAPLEGGRSAQKGPQEGSKTPAKTPARKRTSALGWPSLSSRKARPAEANPAAAKTLSPGPLFEPRRGGVAPASSALAREKEGRGRKAGRPSSKPGRKRKASPASGGQEKRRSGRAPDAEPLGASGSPTKEAAAARPKQEATSQREGAPLPRASTPGRKLVLLGSGLTRGERKLLGELRRVCKATLVEEWRSDVTHVVCGVNADRLAKRTFKLLSAILRGKWAVGLPWVVACIAEGAPVPEEVYEVQGDLNGARGGPINGRLRFGEETQLLDKFEVFFAGQFKDREQVEGLLSLSGARLLTRPPLADVPGASPGWTRVILWGNKEAKGKGGSKSQEEGAVRSVSLEWFKVTASLYEHQPFELYEVE